MTDASLAALALAGLAAGLAGRSLQLNRMKTLVRSLRGSVGVPFELAPVLVKAPPGLPDIVAALATEYHRRLVWGPAQVPLAKQRKA